MQQYDLGELQIKEKDSEFCARRGDKAHPYIVSAPVLTQPGASQTGAATSVMLPATSDKNFREITSPLVGTFYRSPSPEQPPFSEVGDRVNPDEVVCIVEAMKVMNEIKAGIGGTIRKILVENASPVEFGQPLFLVEIG